MRHPNFFFVFDAELVTVICAPNPNYFLLALVCVHLDKAKRVVFRGFDLQHLQEIEFRSLFQRFDGLWLMYTHVRLAVDAEASVRGCAPRIHDSVSVQGIVVACSRRDLGCILNTDRVDLVLSARALPPGIQNLLVCDDKSRFKPTGNRYYFAFDDMRGNLHRLRVARQRVARAATCTEQRAS